VKGPLVRHLDDELAEVRLDDLRADGLERRVELDLLRHHRLGLDDELGALPLCEVRDVPASFGSIRGEEDVPAPLLDVGRKLVDVAVEVGQRVGADARDLIDCGGPLRFGARRFNEGLHVVLALSDDLLQHLVAEGALHALVEGLP